MTEMNFMDLKNNNYIVSAFICDAVDINAIFNKTMKFVGKVKSSKVLTYDYMIGYFIFENKLYKCELPERLRIVN